MVALLIVAVLLIVGGYLYWRATRTPVRVPPSQDDYRRAVSRRLSASTHIIRYQ